ncbi:aspartyl protease family protein [Arcticibacter eurypsychrophilus]|uniref:aspartyl protease family protein n=1 Tax=Arcticibacter eurypsychrophilus TaxID=1434752 RepID=UPI00084D0C6F|nr:aspartyl protease family protein [Arcticibacter eurypsychrophilus]
MIALKPYLKVVLIVLHIFYLESQIACAQEFYFLNQKKQLSIAFKLVKNLIVIPVKINQKGPYNFLLDTGIGMCLITNPSLIDSLKLKNLGSIRITGFGQGDELRASIAPKISMQIGKTRTDSIPAIILNNDLLELSETLGIPIYGLIGYDFFNSFIVEIRYSTQRLVLHPFEQGFKERKHILIPISLEEKKPYVFVTMKSDNGTTIPLKLIIDTGAGHAISLENYNGKSFLLPKKNIKANLGVGLLGPINGHIARIKNLKISKFTLNDVVSSFPEYNETVKGFVYPNRNGNLGNPVLKKFQVTFDYSRNRIYLKPSSHFKEPFEHDMSGLELITIGPDFKRIFISRVEPLSAGEDVGLRSEDEILSIDFKPVKEIGLEEINALFSSKDNRSFILNILSKGTNNRYIILKLKKRI